MNGHGIEGEAKVVAFKELTMDLSKSGDIGT